jgi:hypothetical protein
LEDRSISLINSILSTFFDSSSISFSVDGGFDMVEDCSVVVVEERDEVIVEERDEVVNEVIDGRNGIMTGVLAGEYNKVADERNEMRASALLGVSMCQLCGLN